MRKRGEDVTRWNSGADGGREGIYQNLSINVSEYKSLYLEADIKVISNTLGDSGWWSDVYGKDGEFPVHILQLSCLSEAFF